MNESGGVPEPVEGFDGVVFENVDGALVSRGAAALVGAEIAVSSGEVPWAFQSAAARGFLEIAGNGAVVAKGDTFGPEDGAFTCHVGYGADGNGETLVQLEITVNDAPGTHDADEMRALERLGVASRLSGDGTLPFTAVATPRSNPVAFQDYDASRPLDANDPMDAAILRRIAELEAQPEGDAPEAAVPTEASPRPGRSTRPGFGRRRATP